MILSIVIGYYGSTIHKPRLLFLLNICAGIGSLLFITPMFISDELNTIRTDENRSFYQVHQYQTNSSGISEHQLFLCKGSSQPTSPKLLSLKRIVSAKMQMIKDLKTRILPQRRCGWCWS